MPTRTFLFSDIEGSTQRWRERPEEMRETLAAHDRLVEGVIAEAGGRIFKHTGDGIAAVFESADEALTASAEFQRRLTSKDVPALETLRVRIGVHTGDAEERDGDWFGFTVSRTARLMDAGHGGQVLVSSITQQLASPGRFELRDLGEHRLPDLGRPERIFQLLAPGIEADFPPLRTVERAPNNLPVMTTSFVGRDQELAEVAKLIAGARLVTITGVGGSGKTRVALHTAADLAAEHPDGVWLVELAPVTDPDLVDGAIVTAIGAALPSGKTPREALLDHLSGRDALLVVDNCEHLISSAAETIEAILTHTADVEVLATSRELLGVPGEVSYGLRSMRIPSDAGLEALRSSDAVRLFEERAAAAKPDFRVTEDNVDAVAEICRRLDGMPLAIELAASRLRSFGPAQIAEHLDQRFRLLTGGSRTALPRQQTLTATIDWSYRLLSDAEAALFRRLSVFQGGFTFDAVRAVVTGAPVDELDLLELLPALVDKSLLVVDHDEHESRYRLLETLRQFARDRLDETGEADAWRERHADHFADLSRQATLENLNGPKAEEWRKRILSEADNIRQAITWSLDARRPVTAMHAAYGLGRIFLGKGQWSEILAIYRRIAEQADDLPEHLRTELTYKLGVTLIHSPEPDRGIERLEEAIEHYDSLAASGTDPELLEHHPVAILNLAVALFHQGRAGEHNELFVELVTRMLEMVRERGDKVLEAAALANLAHHRDPRGDPVETREMFDEAEAAARESGIMDPDAFASQRAYFEFDQGEYVEARHLWERSISHADSVGGATAHEDRACLAAVRIVLGDSDDRTPFDDAIRELFSDEDTRTSLYYHQTLLAFRAGLDARAGRHEDVARVAGAIEVINAATGNAVRWDLQDFVADAERSAREALGDAAFEAVRSDATNMTPEQVTSLLLAEDSG